jgi:hybrid cluster-associated redox disulfide protein
MGKEIKLAKNTTQYAKKKTKKFTKNLTIGEALKMHNDVEAVLTGFGMHCFTCPFSQMETLEQAAMVHGVSIDLMIEKLNELLK